MPTAQGGTPVQIFITGLGASAYLSGRNDGKVSSGITALQSPSGGDPVQIFVAGPGASMQSFGKILCFLRSHRTPIPQGGVLAKFTVHNLPTRGEPLDQFGPRGVAPGRTAPGVSLYPGGGSPMPPQ